MTSAHMHDMVREWNDTAAPYPRDALIPELFAQQVQQRPASPALVWDGGGWDYRQLNTRVQRAAAHLRTRGVCEGDLVAVLLERSPQTVVAIMAVLEAGGVFVSLEPAAPDARLETILGATEVRYVITGPGPAPAPVRRRCQCVTTTELEEHPDSSTPRQSATGRCATDPAYIFYTSGSTGTPKGVVCTHRGPVRLVTSGGDLQFLPEDRLLATTSPTFDISCLELFGSLLNGACLIVPEPGTPLSTDALDRTLRDQRASVMWLTSGLFDQHVQQRPGMFANLRCLIVGGDIVTPSSARAVLEHGRPPLLLNGYGPTENSLLSITHRIEDVPDGASSVPIGRPVPNSTAYVIREGGELAAVEEIGELWLGGDGVALGYLGAPEITASSFGPDPEARLYRSGDLAYWRPDGVLEYCGRLDRQVKLRGHRIELSEIETILASHPQVIAAAVDVLGEGNDQLLAAAVTPVPRTDTRGLISDLSRYARESLPPYMVPTRIATIQELPFKSSGKVDRRALLDLMAQQYQSPPVPSGSAPQGPAEEAMAAVWADLLGIDTPGHSDHFFALGGNSLRAVQVAVATLDLLRMPHEECGPLIHSLANDPTLGTYTDLAESFRVSPGDRTSRTSLDLSAETVLDSGLRFTAGRLGPPTDPRVVLLTGGTGFLGVHLIDRLVDVGVDLVFCLVRADDTPEAEARIAERMRRYGLDPTRYENVIVPVLGDLAEPRFGIDIDTWGRLSMETELIVHNGAHVNFLYPYETLKPTNVTGTRTVLELAAEQRLKPVHYISTMSVIAGGRPAEGGTVHEDTALRHPESLLLGYEESKWVAEQLIFQAAERGLPTSLYRPYDITGTQDRGLWNTDTLMCALVRTIAETGAAPGIGLPLDFVPVDYTAAAITHILTHQQPDGRVYHLSNPSPAHLPLLVDRLRAEGYSILEQPYASWVDRIIEVTDSDPDHPMAPYLQLLVKHRAASGLSVLETYCTDTFPAFSRANTHHALRGSGIVCPPVDAHLLDTYLRYFRESGFLSPPG
ncbi:amino acid adenylation domain-containing protein [Streptomyces zagrosensis]|uniref:Amino acid adenylation domain-containing protein/thioester reductase-like protein n=1 Tax=Streptomyces zagrosensis TaxID=1042984 RepID=A0A7W9QAX8_9ACTN|nr:amino acid adenylation domain-containing protein [Streptomyces zagrosensis]MBB5936418.1 amino acid adenylation domain-containing protein/thioester reductase-like protein [Streptomyces zagrosensis]